MKNVILGIDEFTIIFMPKEKYGIDEWDKKARVIVDDFFQLSQIEAVFDGKKSRMTEKLPAGYTEGYDVGLKDFYFAVAYNRVMPDMCVCVRFSAKAWSVYQARYAVIFGKRILLSQFLRMVSGNPNVETRLSKIDFTADYFDFGIDLDNLYQGLKSEKVIVQSQDGFQRIKTIQCVEKDRHVETVYIGSRKGNARSFLRIYNKRDEQIQTHGFRIDEALDCEEWIRFETVFRGQYAHQITQILLKDDMDEEKFTRFIAFCIASKYRLCDTRFGEFLECTDKLLELIKTADFVNLRSESPRDNSLSQNIRHLEHGSGFFPTLYKIEKLYGEEAVEDFFKYLFTQYKKGFWLSSSMYNELKIWLKKHSGLRLVSLEDNY